MRKCKALLLFAAVICLSYAAWNLSDWHFQQTNEEKALSKAREIMYCPQEQKVSLPGMNPDYVCWLQMKNVSINLPIVQGRDDAFYLTHAFDGTDSSYGTPFFSAESRRDDPVRIIYGHRISYGSDAMFSPLEHLLERTGESCEFTLTYDAYQESYAVTHVFHLPKDSTLFSLTKHSFSSEEDFSQWIAYPENNNVLSKTTDCSRNDKYVLLQTCTGRKDLLLIVIGKQIQSETIVS